ncbi:hypothetical protein HY256_10590 [Candidatus Sumerlaeota bacterium]|nr:hypothetical protein [Candidatus Sumerlaeota bacterium]
MAIEWVTREDADQTGTYEEQVLLEQTPDHYPEFAQFLDDAFANAGGALFFRGDSGMVYRVGYLKPGESRGLRGLAIYTRLIHGNQTVTADLVDNDLWPFLEWLMAGVAKINPEWSLDALRTTGAIYKVPGAPERA